MLLCLRDSSGAFLTSLSLNRMVVARRYCVRRDCWHSTSACATYWYHAVQAQQEYERRLKEELEIKALKEQEIAELVRMKIHIATPS